jgi:amidase
MLDAVHGATDGDLFRAPPPAGPFAEELGRPLAPLRIALLTSGGRYQVDPGCVAGAERTAAILESLGHHVEPVGDEVLLGEASTVNGRLWMAQIARRVDHLGELAGRPVTADEVEPYNWTAAERGRSMPAHEWLGLIEAQQAWACDVIDWLADYDLLITPTAGCPALPTAELEPPAEKPWRMGATYGRIGVFTLPFNVTGQPAISLPLHQTDDGLPVGVQLVAGMGREDLLLQVAAVLEEAMPWRDRRPVVFAGNA